MHELAVTRAILDIALENAGGTKEAHIIEINLVIGELSSIGDESVQFYFDALSEGTAAQGAKLNFKRLPARFECTVCKRQFKRKEHTFRCPHCGADARICEGGTEFYIDSMVVEN
jgi:hydrogenase nickel incorporation protein HypA/HybF